MYYKLFIPIAIMLICSCQQNRQRNSQDPLSTIPKEQLDSIMALAQEQAAQADTLGTLILSIDCSVKATPGEASGDSILPWVNIEKNGYRN
ncbi:hypothetical protein [Chitinophaga pinensis]|uniref:Uncharacterized protein n=1 Tax=Chitinophaga pinensis TaxID=79329 RepID=A0A5C6LWC9_9BACT|nr:hypothetical protein [Chitinophaga pinensis]TWW00850.1 hypothetical protein FEF09_10185 [Chitinophaga pinensis]